MAGGRIVGVAVLGVNRSVVFVQELHSTKGWRRPIVVSANHFVWAPVVGSFSWATKSGEKVYDGPSDAGRLMRGRTNFVQVRNPNLMAHGWYRRKLLATEVNDAQL